MALEAAEQIANMMVMEPYPGFEGALLQDAVPQRAAQAGAEAASADVDGLHQPRHHQGGGAASASARWRSPSSTRRRRAPGARSTTTSSRATPACRSATASTPTSPWCRRSRCTPTATRRCGAGRRASSSSATPSPRWSPTTRCPAARGCSSSSRRSAAAARWAPTAAGTEALSGAFQRSRGIGTPDDFREHVRAFEAAGVDQIILLQQAGRNRHEHICESLELFAARGAARVHRPRPPSASAARPRSWRPSSRRRWRARSGCRRSPTPIFRSCARRWPSRSSTSRRHLESGARLSWVHLQASASSISAPCCRGRGRR